MGLHTNKNSVPPPPVFHLVLSFLPFLLCALFLLAFQFLTSLSLSFSLSFGYLPLILIPYVTFVWQTDISGRSMCVSGRIRRKLTARTLFVLVIFQVQSKLYARIIPN